MVGKSRRSFATIVPALLALVFARAAPAPIRAQAEADWVGKRVVPRSPSFLLRIDDEPVEASRKAIAIYRVERTDDGPSLWLRAEGQRLSGWAKAGEVVPIDRAADFFTKQVRAHPKDPFPCLMRAVVRRDHGEIEGALNDYSQAIRLDSKGTIAYSHRGDAWAAKMEYDKAIADYSAAIRLDPRCVLAYIGRGRVRAHQKEFDGAIEDFSEAIWLDPLALDAYSQRGRAWQSKGESQKAIIDHNVVIRLDPQNRSAFHQRGRAWKALNAYGKALADLDEAVRLDPSAAAAYHDRAAIWATCPDARYRDGKKALASAAKACELTGWKDPWSLDTLAAAYAEAGDFDAAVTWQTRANHLGSGAENQTKGKARLELYRAKKPYRDTAP